VHSATNTQTGIAAEGRSRQLLTMDEAAVCVSTETTTTTHRQAARGSVLLSELHHSLCIRKGLVDCVPSRGQAV